MGGGSLNTPYFVPLHTINTSINYELLLDFEVKIHLCSCLVAYKTLGFFTTLKTQIKLRFRKVKRLLKGALVLVELETH